MNKTETAIFGGGCFWCTEAIFKELKGVQSVMPGYAGGSLKNPTYEEVSSGTTGHAEVIKITYDPNNVSYTDLLDVFWHTHNPTTLNRQGNDVGTQYRSAIFYSTEEQKRAAYESLNKLAESHTFSDPIVTEIKPLDMFYKAENYHENYFATHTDAPYCQIVIAPKLQAMRIKYRTRLTREH